VQTLNYFPGQRVTIFLETVDGYGARSDSLSMPLVNRVIFPSLTLASAYPQPMTQLDIGLYYYQFILPTGAISIGNYLVDVVFTNPANNTITTTGYQIVVSAPFGNFSTTIG
jgi:hypothetical protein